MMSENQSVEYKSKLTDDFQREVVAFLNTREGGRSQQQLADELGITRTRYSKYEYGIAEPPIDLLVKIARYYGLTIDEIISVDLYRVS